jgi:hypothetical protein
MLFVIPFVSLTVSGNLYEGNRAEWDEYELKEFIDHVVNLHGNNKLAAIQGLTRQNSVYTSTTSCSATSAKTR